MPCGQVVDAGTDVVGWRRSAHDDARRAQRVLDLPDGQLAASVFHFGELTVGQVKDALRAAGVVVR